MCMRVSFLAKESERDTGALPISLGQIAPCGRYEFGVLMTGTLMSGELGAQVETLDGWTQDGIGLWETIVTCFSDGRKTFQQIADGGTAREGRVLELDAHGKVVKVSEGLKGDIESQHKLLAGRQCTEDKCRETAEKGDKLAKKLKEKYPITQKDIKRLMTKFEE